MIARSELGEPTLEVVFGRLRLFASAMRKAELELDELSLPSISSPRATPPQMAPSQTSQVLLSPAELSYLHDQLSLTPPIRPDGRTPTQFRPLVAETDILPSANGSARVCFADGTEAIVGVKAEVEKSQWRPAVEEHGHHLGDMEVDDEIDGDGQGRADAARGAGRNEWVEMSIEVPGYRDDDTLPTFLAAMLTEALQASGELKDRLWINRRFHWKLCIDILLLSPPLSYPLPLLSLTTHLALLSARLPKLKSELDEDPLFDDDWEASTYLYPYSHNREQRLDRPPITLLVITVGSNIIFDPSREELAVAESLLALSVGMLSSNKAPSHPTGNLKLLAIRAIDPPSRLTPPAIPNSVNNTNGDGPTVNREEAFAAREVAAAKKECWSPPRGGIHRGLLNAILKMTIENGGVAEDVLTGLVQVQS